jgi:hypothetical protein
MAANTVVWTHCGRKNRMPSAANGSLRCGHCHSPLPWIVDAHDGDFTEAASLAATVPHLDCKSCGISLPEAARDLGERAFMVVVQDFQDPYTLNVEEITPDGRLIPLCAYNSVGYREQVRAQMSGVPVADAVPNATELRPLIADSPYGSKIARTSDQAPPGRDATNVGRRAVRP